MHLAVKCFTEAVERVKCFFRRIFKPLIRKIPPFLKKIIKPLVCHQIGHAFWNLRLSYFKTQSKVGWELCEIIIPTNYFWHHYRFWH